MDAYREQYDAASASVEWLRYDTSFALRRFGDREIGSLSAQQIGAWRTKLPDGRRHLAHRALRQVLEAAVRWKWIEENPATLVKNPEPRRGEIDPFESWEEIEAIAAELDDVSGPLVVFLGGTGVWPEEAFGAEWRDVDLDGQVLTVRRAFAKRRLKDYAKTEGSRRAVPLRDRVVDAPDRLDHRHGIVFPSPGGGRGDINNRRNRCWTPALAAAGLKHRRIYDLRHTYASWSLAAGIDIFTLARRMGTSVKMLDRTYGHLVAGADARERELLNAFDGGDRRCVGAGSREGKSECA